MGLAVTGGPALPEGHFVPGAGSLLLVTRAAEVPGLRCKGGAQGGPPWGHGEGRQERPRGPQR